MSLRSTSEIFSTHKPEPLKLASPSDSFTPPASNTNVIEGRRFQTQQFINKHRAIDFVCEYVPSFCVYCANTNQLYTSYDLHNLEQASGVIVLPRNDHDTFCLTEDNAVLRTKFVMITKANLKRPRLLDLRQKGNVRSAQTSLFNLALKKRLLPVVMKSDLRKLKKSDMPYLTMHTIDISRLASMSAFRCSQIESAVLEKLEASLPRWSSV